MRILVFDILPTVSGAFKMSKVKVVKTKPTADIATAILFISSVYPIQIDTYILLPLLSIACFSHCVLQKLNWHHPHYQTCSSEEVPHGPAYEASTTDRSRFIPRWHRWTPHCRPAWRPWCATTVVRLRYRAAPRGGVSWPSGDRTADQSASRTRTEQRAGRTPV